MACHRLRVNCPTLFVALFADLLVAGLFSLCHQAADYKPGQTQPEQGQIAGLGYLHAA